MRGKLWLILRRPFAARPGFCDAQIEVIGNILDEEDLVNDPIEKKKKDVTLRHFLHAYRGYEFETWRRWIKLFCDVRS